MYPISEITSLVYGVSDPKDPYLVGLYGSLSKQTIDWNGCINYWRFLYWLVKTRKPKVALEIGVEYGAGSAHMCSAAKSYGGQVIGIDLHWHNIPGELVVKHYGNYHYIVGDSTSPMVEQSVKDIVGQYGKMGVVFQDSSHHYAPSEIEWAVYSRMLDVDPIWICDDITPSFFEVGVDEKSMVAYFNERPGKHLLFPDVLHYGNTIGVILL
jgi:hypothetical protein